MTYERVNLKRFVAAIIDSIIVSIIVMIPTTILSFVGPFSAYTDDVANSFFTTGMFDFEQIITTDYLNYTLVTTIIAVVVGYLWFVYVPAKSAGQTVGKKIMTIKVIDENGENPTHSQHLKRSIQNWSNYVAFPLLFIGYVSATAFVVINGIVGSIVGIFVFISYLMILFKIDGRGLHDLWTNTTVVRADINLNKSFQEKTAQMGDWADVEGEQQKQEEDDEWRI